MIRSELLKIIKPLITDQLVVCNIGLPSQELHLIDDQPSNFYMLGTMGLASSIGLGVALAQDKKVIAIDGHVDTVDVGDPAQWDRDPFSGDVEDGILYGRGTSDMKGGVASAVYAGALLKKAAGEGSTVIELTDDELAQWKAVAPVAQKIILDEMGDAAKAKWAAIQDAKAACSG